jgi:acetylornithine/succinyldiaminopimelate/putrescine aminotransferase
MAKAGKHLALEPDFEDFEITCAEGVHVFDSRRRKYLDFLSGWCVGNLGWNQDDLAGAIRDFDGPFFVPASAFYPPWAELADMLIEIAPGRLAKCFRATGGSEAVDIALQAAMLHTGRSKFVTVEGSYHGNSFAARGVAASDTGEKFPHPLSAKRIASPLDDNALDRVEAALKRKDVAAFIMEPVLLNVAVTIPHHGFMKGLQALCKRYGTLLIMDEVATAFGRTGRMFASEHFGIVPDIMTLAKAITGGHAGMGACLMTAPVAKSMQKVGAYSTYGWHPVSVAVALANLRYWKRHGTQVLKNVVAMGELIKERLRAIAFRKGASVRGLGLAIAADIGDASYAEKITERCREKGLLIASDDTALTFFPPLVIDEKAVNEGMDILERCA